MDDTFWTNPKLQRLSDKAHRLYMRGLGYCSQHLTDGVLDATALRTLNATARHCDELVAGGCWDVVPDGGYTVHDYLEFNFSREEIIERRRQDAERQARRRGKANQDPTSGRYTS